MTQFVTVTFGFNSQRTYTYRNDGDPVAIGDKVDIMSRSNSVVSVEVVEVTETAPSYECKPILGLTKLPEEKSEAAE